MKDKNIIPARPVDTLVKTALLHVVFLIAAVAVGIFYFTVEKSGPTLSAFIVMTAFFFLLFIPFSFSDYQWIIIDKNGIKVRSLLFPINFILWEYIKKAEQHLMIKSVNSRSFTQKKVPYLMLSADENALADLHPFNRKNGAVYVPLTEETLEKIMRRFDLSAVMEEVY
jgi:hypothetical protein